MHQTSVYFGDETWPAIKAWCAAEGITVSSFIREATQAHLATIEQRHRAAYVDARLAGELAELRGRVEQLEQMVGRRR